MKRETHDFCNRLGIDLSANDTWLKLCDEFETWAKHSLQDLNLLKNLLQEAALLYQRPLYFPAEMRLRASKALQNVANILLNTSEWQQDNELAFESAALFMQCISSLSEKTCRSPTYTNENIDVVVTQILKLFEKISDEHCNNVSEADIVFLRGIAELHFADFLLNHPSPNDVARQAISFLFKALESNSSVFNNHKAVRSIRDILNGMVKNVQKASKDTQDWLQALLGKYSRMENLAFPVKNLAVYLLAPLGTEIQVWDDNCGCFTSGRIVGYGNLQHGIYLVSGKKITVQLSQITWKLDK